MGTIGNRRYAGGGLFMESANTYPSSFDVRVYTNTIHSNDIQVDPGFDVGTGPNTESGAGVFTNFSLDDGSTLEITGNAVYSNSGGLEGGGLFLNSNDIGTAAQNVATVDHNTFVFNELRPNGLGGGFFSTSGSEFSGTNNIVFENASLGSAPSDQQWHAEAPLGNPAPTFTYSQLPSLSSGSASGDLFGANSGTAAPLLANDDPHINRKSSPCIDSGDPGSVFPVAIDIDGETRGADILPLGTIADDRGADEAFVPFNRGDANSDLLVNVADIQTTLDYVFGIQPAINCLDAYDANDDGTVDLSDSVRLVDFLFNAGAPPPPPFSALMNCGWDPTLDNIECVDPNVNPCP